MSLWAARAAKQLDSNFEAELFYCCFNYFHEIFHTSDKWHGAHSLSRKIENYVPRNLICESNLFLSARTLFQYFRFI